MSWIIDLDKGKAVTPVFTACYAFVHTPQPQNANYGGDKKEEYKVTMVFPLGTDFEPLVKLIKDVAEKKWGSAAEGILRKQEKTSARVFKDGSDKVGTAGFIDGAVYLSAKTNVKPGVVKKVGGKIIDLDEKEFYSGCKAIASIVAKAYEVSDEKTGAKIRGVNLRLHNIMKVEDGTPLAGSAPPASSDFGGDDVPETKGESAEDAVNSLFD